MTWTSFVLVQLNQRLSSPCLSGHFTTICHNRDLAQERALFLAPAMPAATGSLWSCCCGKPVRWAPHLQLGSNYIISITYGDLAAFGVGLPNIAPCAAATESQLNPNIQNFNCVIFLERIVSEPPNRFRMFQATEWLLPFISILHWTFIHLFLQPASACYDFVGNNLHHKQWISPQWITMGKNKYSSSNGHLLPCIHIIINLPS